MPAIPKPTSRLGCARIVVASCLATTVMNTVVVSQPVVAAELRESATGMTPAMRERLNRQQELERKGIDPKKVQKDFEPDLHHHPDPCDREKDQLQRALCKGEQELSTWHYQR